MPRSSGAITVSAASTAHPTARPWRTAILIAVGATLLLLPALATGHPFVYWDTPTFYGWGHDILAAVSKPWPPLSEFPAHRGLWAADNFRGAWDRITPEQFQLVLTAIGARSSFYAVPFYALGSMLTLWAPAVVQSLLMAWLLRITVAATLPGAPPLAYLGLVAMLATATTASFFAAFLMPDVFAALAVLAAGLLLCFPDQLTLSGRIGCAALVATGVLVHLSILPAIAALLVLGAGTVRVLAPTIPVWRGAALATAALVCAGAASVAVGTGMRAIFGQDVRSPPFVEGRVIADGPGQQFLREACALRPFAACLYKDLVVRDTDDIIWPDVSWHGLPLITDPVERRRYLDEQLTVVLGTLFTHPFAQLQASARNAAKQLSDFTFSSDIETSLTGLLSAGSDRTLRIIQIVPNIAPCLADGGKSCDPTPLLEAAQKPLQAVVAVASLVLAAIAAAWLQPRRGAPAGDHRRRLGAFAIVIVAGVILNGVVCGALSGPWGRYQARVIWLIPMAAALMVGDLLRSPNARLPTTSR